MELHLSKPSDFNWFPRMQLCLGWQSCRAILNSSQKQAYSVKLTYNVNTELPETLFNINYCWQQKLLSCYIYVSPKFSCELLCGLGSERSSNWIQAEVTRKAIYSCSQHNSTVWSHHIHAFVSIMSPNAVRGNHIYCYYTLDFKKQTICIRNFCRLIGSVQH